MVPAVRPDGKRGGDCVRSFAQAWRASYASDYVGFFLLLGAYILIQFFVDPFHRMFYIDNLDISFPHAEHERVPVEMNFVYALFIPLFAMTLFNVVTRSHVHKYHITILGIAIALVLTSTITDIIKNMVGRPRPDLLDRCQPSADTPRHELVTFTVCTQTNRHKLHEGWRSFPSGHSSFAFAGLGYMTLFLAGQLKVFVLRSQEASPAEGPGVGEGDAEKIVHVRGDLGKVLICLSPLLGALMIAISRCQDYRHDVYDVCTGGLLGWTIAYWSYRRYWPKLHSLDCDKPYPPPSSKYARLRDEEEGLPE